MIDHFGFVVRDIVGARRFYEAALGALGLVTVEDYKTAFIMARSQSERIPFVFIGEGRPSFWAGDSQPGVSPAHYAFSARDRAMVDAFHKAGLAAGGRDNGAPGIRRGGSYGAFLLDADNNNIEANFRG